MNYSIVSLDELIPASYNPRSIDDDSFVELRESLRVLGDLIPVIVNKDNNTIIAGHQRTKALKANGENTVKAFYVSNVNISDEILFNQMHNFQDIEKGCEGYIDDTGLSEGFQEVDVSRFDIHKSNRNIGDVVNRLLSHYGNVLTAVCCNGRVIIGNIYIDICRLTGINPNVYILDKSKYEVAQNYLLRRYGVFNYDKLKRMSYVQGLAQPLRSIKIVKGKRSNSLRLYIDYIFPKIPELKGKKVLDFGAGKMVFAKRLAEFVEVCAIEFFINNGREIDSVSANSLIDYFVNSIRKTGLFPYVINEFVINSVDCKEAEDSVMGCLNAFCQMGGTLFFGTRKLENNFFEQRNKTGCISVQNNDKVRFLDKNLFTATFRQGQWYYQHFHTEDSVKKLLSDFGFDITSFKNNGCQFFITARKTREITDEAKVRAISYEFNLPLPNNRTYNRHNDVLAVMREKGFIK